MCEAGAAEVVTYVPGDVAVVAQDHPPRERSEISRKTRSDPALGPPSDGVDGAGNPIAPAHHRQRLDPNLPPDPAAAKKGGVVKVRRRIGQGRKRSESRSA